MELKQRVALRIKSIRQRRGLTQEQLAERVERSVDAISNLERGLSLPGFETLERLAAVLKVPVKDFFDFGEASSDPARVALLVAINDTARSLTTSDLEVALRQIEALTVRGAASS